LKTKHRWREDENREENTEHDDERERENEEEGNDHEKELTKREINKTGNIHNSANCGCCCDESDKKKKKQKEDAHNGDPDETDDVREIPINWKRPKPTVDIKKPKPPAPEPPKEPEPGKGELNKDYGLYVERPFYIITAIGENRYVDVVDERNVVIKTPNEYDSQKWWFDQHSKTIKNKMYNDRSLDITKSGKTNDMQIWSTNG